MCLNLVTSFTGKDTLITGLQSFGYQGGLLGANGLQNALFPGSVLNSGSANVSFSPQFAGVDPQNLASSANNLGGVQLYKLLYVFPVSKQVTAFVFPKAETTDAFPQIIPWASESQGAVSRFAGVKSGGASVWRHLRGWISLRCFHVEGYYRFKLNDNISVTPGVFAVFNPESNSENKTAVVGVVRASFTF